MIEIAKVLKPHGIGGELKAQLFSNNFDEFCDRGFAYVKEGNGYRRISYTALRVSPPYVYFRIDGIDTRNDAETLHGIFLYLDRSDFKAPDEGEYYVHDLIGLDVVGEGGRKLGVLKDVLQHGAADVYVVAGDAGFMFPALRRVIGKVDLERGVILVNEAALREVAVYDV
ncbi:MAG: ribosome maturation factor RimM [Eubacteriales bacterium]|nr:ribosome maturation factor RimM [Eubacteriales bacterium]